MTLTTQVTKTFYALAGAGGFAAQELPRRARNYAGTATGKVNQVYDDLAVRSRKVVRRVSHQAARELADVSQAARPEGASDARRQTPAKQPTGSKAPSST